MSMILIKLAPDFDKSTLNPNLDESKIWFDEMAEQLYNSKLEVEKKNLEKGGTPNPEIKEMDEHFTAMTGLEMDSNRGFKFVLTEDGNHDIEKTTLHGYDSVYQYTSVWDDLLETRKTVMNFMSPKNLKAEFDEKDIASLLRTFERNLSVDR